MRQNIGSWDSAIRIILGIALFGVGAIGVVGGALRFVSLALAVVALVTGMTGYCPLYDVLHIRTKRA